MSLQVWLPLDGTLENKGVSGVIPSGNIYYDVGGKTCNKFHTGGQISITSPVKTTEFSISFWAKITTSFSNLFRLPVLVDGSTSNTLTATRVSYSGYNAIKLYTLNPVNTPQLIWLYDSNYTGDVKKWNYNEWTHFTYTFTLPSGATKSVVKAFINGELAQESASNNKVELVKNGSITFGETSSSAPEKFQDIKVYDHCLSVREIKELSQGLCLHYKMCDGYALREGVEPDCSGYLYNGYMHGTTGIINYSDSLKYNGSYYFNKSDNDYIKIPLSPFPTLTPIYEATFSITASPSVVNGNFWSFSKNKGIRCRPSSSTGFWLYLWNGTSNYTFTASLPSGKSFFDGDMHNIVVVFNNGNIKLYFDSQLISSSTLQTTFFEIENNTLGWVGAGADDSEMQTGGFSDFRIYASTLSEEDIVSLYKVKESIDNLGNVYAGEYIESGDTIKFSNKSIITCESINDSGVLYDDTLYEEPDGTKWIRIAHHSNPKAGMFPTTTDWTKPVYIDGNRWFNAILCGSVTCGDGTYNLMIKQKPTSDGTELKYRWRQGINPMTATYAQVAASSIIKITGSGYASIASNYGGLYRCASEHSCLVANIEGYPSYWFGAVGCKNTSFNTSSIPGYNGVTVSTGYLDLYLRVDNVTFEDQNTAKIFKNGTLLGKNLIES